MKKVFQIVGILFGILLIFFFLQYSNYAIFPMRTDEILDCSVENAITSIELSEIAKANHITAFTITYNDTSFFNRNIHFDFLNINPDDQICLGTKNRLLPSTQINYMEHGDEVSYIQKFWALKSKDADFIGFMDQLKTYVPAYDHFDPVKLNFLYMLNLQNLHFYGCVFMIFFLSNFIWFCISAEKKSVLKSCSDQVLYEAMPYLFVSSAFGIYIILADPSFLLDFVQTFAAFGFLLFVVNIAGAGLAFMIAQVIRRFCFAYKVKRAFVFTILSVFAFITACIFAVSTKNAYFSIMDLPMFEHGANIMSSLSPAYITTAKIPDAASTDQLLSIYDEIENRDVYNYAHPTSTLSGYRGSHKKEAREQMSREPSVVRMSYNMLDYIQIYGDDGVQLCPQMFHQEVTTLLIPENLKDNSAQIARNFYGSEDFNIGFIQSNQEHFDILDPRKKVVNAIYMLTPIEKDIYYTNGRVLFGKNSVAVVAKRLRDCKFDAGTISLNELSTDYEMIRDDLKLVVISNGLLWIMDFICCITALSMGRRGLLQSVKKDTPIKYVESLTVPRQ